MEIGASVTEYGFATASGVLLKESKKAFAFCKSSSGLLGSLIWRFTGPPIWNMLQ